MRDLQSAIGLLTSVAPALIKALPLIAGYLLIAIYARALWKSRSAQTSGQELAYALVGLSSFLWVIGR